MQRFNINWTAKALVNQMEKGKVNYDNAVQRSLVWDVDKKIPSDPQHDLRLCDPRHVFYP